MRDEDDKAQVELRVFEKFVMATGIVINRNSVRKGYADLGEPDIYCEMEEGAVYFELAESCAPEFAAAITHSLKTDNPKFTSGGDTSTQTIRKKLRKRYKVPYPIELILYVAGRTALPDNVLVTRIEPFLSKGLGQFRRIWLFGDKVQCIASNG